jgi:hypothetical protein
VEERYALCGILAMMGERGCGPWQEDASVQTANREGAIEALKQARETCFTNAEAAAASSAISHA